jgi:hypothetical protein
MPTSRTERRAAQLLHQSQPVFFGVFYREACMWKPIAALTVLIPSVTFASPIYVEYEGVVTSLFDCDCNSTGYQIGDTIKGVITIHSNRPGDANPNPAQGDYGTQSTPDFITSIGAPITRDTPFGQDSINVLDNVAGTGDYWGISDQFQPSRGQGILGFFAQSETLDFVHGDSILQNLNLTPAPGLTLRGFLSHYWKGTAANWTSVGFDLLKLTQRPGSCRAP